MNLKEIYDLAVEVGISVDLRGTEEIEKKLERTREKYEELDDEEQEEFEQEKLDNPYADTRILYGDPETEVQKILVGIDIEVGEVLIADRLREKGEEIDLIISHHPEGKALANLHQVMHMQEEILHLNGVPINVAQGIMAKRIKEVERNLMPVNHNKALDAAKIFDIPLMSVHTPADNLVTDFLQNKIDEAEPERVEDVIELLKEIPEYKEAVNLKAGPKVIVGSKERKTGKVVVDMTGGTSGSKEAFKNLAQAGVGTLVCMHMGEEHRKKAEENHINVIIAGHIASDSLGMNLFIDKLTTEGIEVTSCSGLIRVERGE
ncbi:Nif3-like dinuclear metal center hexameric protein [Fuchsiella alkaliacetigena]|uniref:Nif3-like dinuclear metal center hexameric protein n=1 Tax=Fuchsiella alkaliacetigena TaxID=957042 RepID=UPI00200B2BF2|nr:Nif3-like dinuclear metal center hexameric protein [Fuchsiella alkaliacetigena]MCK8825990.1 Nif3-like dinuclear metal center hexameric protein [Fuchsiella alkaliacetigena]